MSRLTSTIAAATVATVAGVLVAATAGTADAAPVNPAPSQPRHNIDLHVTSKKIVAAPSKTQPGIAHLRNTGRTEILVLQQKKAGVPTLVKDLNAQSEGPGRLIKDFTLLTVLEPNADVFLPLGRSTVYLSDADLDHYTASKVTTVAVTGARVDDSVPPSNTVTVNHDNLLHATKTIPNSGYLHLRNRGTALSEVVLVQVGKKVTTATLKDFVAHPSLKKLESISPDFDLNFFSVVPAGRSLWQRQHSASGRDVVFNLVLRANTTEPKLHPGQARVVTVG